jgi:hypothetical protein
MADVFLLGAGFSRAIGEEMPLLDDLGRLVWGRVDVPDKKSFLGMFGNNLEMVLTYLSQSHPWLSEQENLRNRALFLDLSSTVRDVLLECMQATARSSCPDWLLSLIGLWHSGQAQVLTMNYDTLPESAVRVWNEKNRIWLWPDYYYPFLMTPLFRFVDEFSVRPYSGDEKTFQLYKLHGSINWLYSGSASFLGETIYYSGFDDVWSPATRLAITQADSVERVPLIVPPVAEKIGYFQHSHVRATWRMAATALQSAERIFCLGYSLPQVDITMRFFLMRNLPVKHAVKLSLVDKEDRSDHFRTMLAGIPHEIDTTFVRPDDPISHFVETLQQENASGGSAAVAS